MIGAFIERYNNGWLLQRHGVHDPGPGPREAQPEDGLMFKPSHLVQETGTGSLSVIL